MTKLGVITGAAGGIGRATAERFSSDGWQLVLVDVDEDVKRFADYLSKRGTPANGVTADVTAEDGVDAVSAAVSEARKPLRFLGLVAGMLGEVGSIETIAMTEWDRIMGVNLRANVLMMKAFIPTMREAGGGSIVTVSSWYGRSGHAFFGAYCASKAAMISLTQSAAAELAEAGIRVNSVAPGNVATRMHFTALAEEAEKRGISADEMKAIEWAKIPLGRAADPSEMAAAIYFLGSDQGSYFTGATLDANGGCGFF
jgi:NAD(P)-dependent dehydrogenase (short-subunit alcohol dehydrogenase family)